MNDRFDLSGRVALITGGSKGIGKSIARGFAQAGADIMIASRHEDDLKRAVAEIQNGSSVRVEYRVCEMGDRAAVRGLAADTLTVLGSADILVNNAGTNEPQTLVDATEESWDRVLELNLTSCMLLARAVVPSMIERKWGRVIHLSSIMGLASNPGRGNYSATKAALIGMTRAHALELGPLGITVNCIAPGPILTELPQSVLSDAQQKVFEQRTALLRWGKPDEMIGPALLLASEAGSFITGTVIVADGGVLCRTFD